MRNLEWMERFAYSYVNAYKYTDSKLWVNEQSPSIARKKLEQSEYNSWNLALFRVKDTNQISKKLVRQPKVFEDYFLKRMRTPHNGFFYEGM